MEATENRRVLFIINPVAGRRLGVRNADFFREQIEAAGYSVTAIETRGPGDAERLAHDGCKSQGYLGAIACTGGDGTFNEVINGIMACENRPPIMYFPAGTTNVTGSGLGLTGAARAIAAKVLGGSPAPYDIGHFTGEGGVSRYFSFMATFGAFSSVSYTTSQGLKNSLGYSAYLLQGIKSLPELKSNRAVIDCGGVRVEDDFIFGAISNSKSVGGMVKINADGLRLDDGLFEALFIRAPKNPLELERIISCLLSGQYDDEHIRFFRTAKISVRSAEAIEWGLDGEFVGALGDISVNVIPGGVRIFC